MTKCLLYKEVFNFFVRDHFIFMNQSSFKPGDCCISQLLSSTHGKYVLFAERYKVWGIFLDISKVFDKVLWEDLMFKLKQNETSGKLLRLIKDFLSDRKQLVVLNGKCSSWMDVQAGVPQDFILGPFLFFPFFLT